jgi:hypothetical protein
VDLGRLAEPVAEVVVVEEVLREVAAVGGGANLVSGEVPESSLYVDEICFSAESLSVAYMHLSSAM